MFAADSRRLFCLADGYVTVFDTETAETIAEFPWGESLRLFCRDMVASPNGSTLVIDGMKEPIYYLKIPTLRIWDTRQWQCLTARSFRGKMITSLAISPDGEHLIAGTLDGQIRCWQSSLLTGRPTF